MKYLFIYLLRRMMLAGIAWAAFAINQSSFAQVPVEVSPEPIFREEGIFSQEKPANHIRLEAVDREALLREDEQREAAGLPFRFGFGFDADYDLNNSGEWFPHPEGKVWKLKVVAQEAFSINFIFDRFKLPEGASLFIYNEDKTALYGPVTSHNNNESNSMGTDLVKGTAVTLEYFLPARASETGELHISRIIHGYQDMFTMNSYTEKLASCHIDVQCTEAADWCVERRAVALIINGDGDKVCSGTMINDVQQDLVPFFLTANHCLGGMGNLSNTVYRFHYWKSVCGASSYSTTYWSFNGATLRANNSATDFALLQLNYNPNDNFARHAAIQYAGWSRSATPAANGTGIHHPEGNPMKFSHDFDPLTAVSWFSGPVNHWRAKFEQGTVQHGSSGSGLFDENHRVIGQLHGDQGYQGGNVFCSRRIGEYGAFHVSWTGNGTNTTRLSNWLDAGGSGAVTTNSRCPIIPFHNRTINSGPQLRTATQDMELAGNVVSGGYLPTTAPSWLFPMIPRVGLPFDVTSTGRITYKAGESIDIRPGVTVQPGAVFEAFISPVTCSDGLDYLYKTQQKPPVAEKELPAAILNDDRVTVFPNPTAGDITIMAKEKLYQGAFVTITNQSGRIMYSGKMAGINHTFNIRSFASGIYIVTLKALNGEKLNKKIFKQ
jgi:Secretion system C-terminal sorting domain/Trypsin-like peptidase domain